MLNVDIQVNGKWVQTVWIARIEKFQGENYWHEYIVGMGPQDAAPWQMQANPDLSAYPHFRHLYRDGARICVERALTALRAFRPDRVGANLT